MSDSGVLLIDKPVGISSFDVIRKLRRITGLRKMGHTGTLDPFASGLLIVCIGKATRISSRIISENKEYTATLKLGYKTETGDLTGKKLENKDFNNITKDDINKIVPQILKIEQQIPHKYSALKVNGRKAYELARKNADFQLQPRPIKILDFKFLDIQIPDIMYRTTVSKGTYIRVLSETIGEMLDTYAVTTELRRTAIGSISLEKAVSLEDLSSESWQESLFPMINLFTELPRIEISEKEKADFKLGRRFRVLIENKVEIVVTCNDQVLGFAEIELNILKPRIVIV
jgi:tRNA pseudouridine55 synthase